MEELKGLLTLLYQAMAATIVLLVDDGELDQGRAITWIDRHTVNLVENEGKYRVEVVEVVEAEEAEEAEEDEDADSP